MPRCCPIRSAATTATSRSTASPRSSSRPRTGRAMDRTGRSTSRATPPGSPSTPRLPLHWPLDDIMDVGRGDGPAPVGKRRRRTGRGRPAAGLRRLLAVRLLLARGARPLPGRGGAPLRAGRRHRQRPAGRACRPCPAAGRWATAGCTASRRCSSATCSFPGGPVSASATADHRRGVPLLAALRRRGRLQRGGVLMDQPDRGPTCRRPRGPSAPPNGHPACSARACAACSGPPDRRRRPAG